MTAIAKFAVFSEWMVLGNERPQAAMKAAKGKNLASCDFSTFDIQQANNHLKLTLTDRLHFERIEFVSQEDHNGVQLIQH
jgi:hypothetical protein